MRRSLFLTSGIPLTRPCSRPPSRFFPLSACSTILLLLPPGDKGLLSLPGDLPGESGRDKEKNLRKADWDESPPVAFRFASIASMMTMALAVGDMDEGMDEAFL